MDDGQKNGQFWNELAEKINCIADQNEQAKPSTME
jgi:hypothetical protein